MHQLGSKLIDFFGCFYNAVFAVHITEAFSLQILPFNRYKVANFTRVSSSQYKYNNYLQTEKWPVSTFLPKLCSELLIKRERTGKLQWHGYTHICISTVACHPFYSKLT